MKTKMKKKCVKILTMIICMVSLVSALVIAPSADITDMEYNDYERIEARFDPSLFPVTVDSTTGLPLGTTNIEIEYNQSIQGWLSLSTSSSDYNSQDYYFNKIKIKSSLSYASGSTTVYYTLQVFLDDVNSISYTVHNKNGSPYMYSLWYLLNGSGTTWYMVNGDTFDLTLFYIPSALSNLSIQNSTNAIVNYKQFSSIGTTNFTKVPQALYSDGYADGLANAPSDGGYDDGYTDGYDEGYIKGVDFGLEEGYGNGYDQGSIDGYQDGYTDGENEGYGIGYDDGYSIGNEEGYSDGYDYGYIDGEKYGWDNGFGAGQNDMAETSHTFKEMVFAIFDAPSRLIDSMLNFDIFGINLAGLVKTIITIAVVAVILVILLKWLL